ncbi:hypothetical protein SEVIR_4G111200v4 [Setaria viridis]|uniref:Sulfotransferase n=1 Tax=Setaria viridis TaxID=4556 RepID=A0A4U6UVY4_SETVI|nr:cytosolic sulfotransferase 5-like [Setaria viridis]TKW20780.1 hypothetical protein SEVIR_4G111200v2 [Setaria viridis]
MATSGSSSQVGPVPFMDVENDTDMVTVVTESPPEEHAGLVSGLPCCTVAGMSNMKLHCYQGFWIRESWVPAAVALKRRFEPRPDDVIVASPMKCGTTWLIALTFATMARRAQPPNAVDHPLRHLNPHQCLPFLEGLFAGGRESELDGFPSPRLMNTHMPLAMIPRAAPPAAGDGSGCRVVYICREPKDMAVSLWHYFRRVHPGLTLGDIVDGACDGTTPGGPFWDHILGYWRASAARPENLLFLRYEDLLRDPSENVRRLARFVGLPFSAAEEDAGVVRGIVELCSLDSLRGMEANRTGYVDSRIKIPREALFRKGVSGDWKNHMTPEMVRRMDEIIADKLHASGITFQ